MASELRQEKNESTDRKLNIATILAGITGIGCLAICALVSGSISFKLSTSVWGKMVGILSIIGGVVKFVDMGVFVERVARAVVQTNDISIKTFKIACYSFLVRCMSDRSNT